MRPQEFDRDKYSASMFVDNDDKYKLYWKHNYEDDTMDFAIEVEATGTFFVVLLHHMWWNQIIVILC